MNLSPRQNALGSRPPTPPTPPPSHLSSYASDTVTVSPDRSDSDNVTRSASRSIKTIRLAELLNRPITDIADLKELLWSGVPPDASHTARSLAWKIMLGCLPLQRERRETVARKRRVEYLALVTEYFGSSVSDEIQLSPLLSTPPQQGHTACEIPSPDPVYAHLASTPIASSSAPTEVRNPTEPSQVESFGPPQATDEYVTRTFGIPRNIATPEGPDRCASDAKILRQIQVDLPRTNPTGFAFFSTPRIQRLMERALFCWAVRNPASGYVQGINDLLTPFIVVFLRAALENHSCTPNGLENVIIDQLPNQVLFEVECDAYWCLSKVLGYIQDNYTFGQPGIQKLIVQLKHIVRRIDEPLYYHLVEQGLDFLQFAFRWMNCLLLREFPIECVIRLWDTYIAEGTDGFSTFHLYVCSVFLDYWSTQLRNMDFQQMLLFMQKFPTENWTAREVDTLIAEAFVLKSLFHSSPKHLEVDRA